MTQEEGKLEKMSQTEEKKRIEDGGEIEIDPKKKIKRKKQLLERKRMTKATRMKTLEALSPAWARQEKVGKRVTMKVANKDLVMTQHGLTQV